MSPHSNDDGSSYYAIHHNFCVFGGHKSDFDGNSKVSSFNLHVYPSVYGTRCLFIGAQVLPPKGYAEGYHDNTCILPDAGDTYFNVQDVAGGGCLGGSSSAKQAFLNGLQAANNTLYVPGGKAVVTCGKGKMSVQDFVSAGYDIGTTVSGDMPSASRIIEMATSLLLQ